MGAVHTFQEGIWIVFSCFSKIALPYQEAVLSIDCYTFAFPDFPVYIPLGCCRVLWDGEQGDGK